MFPEREIAGLSQAAFGQLIGVSPTTISKIETAMRTGGQAGINYDTYDLLCQALGEGIKKLERFLRLSSVGRRPGPAVDEPNRSTQRTIKVCDDCHLAPCDCW